MTISNEAVEAASAAYLDMDKWDASTHDAMRAALEAAAPHMLPAPEGVSEAEIVRHMTHEEWRGCRIESYRWKFKIPGASQGSGWDWSYASHWSTPAAHEEAEALVSVKDAERALITALSSERERAERAERERDQWRTTSIAFATEDSEYISRALVAEAKVKEAGEIIAPFAKVARHLTQGQYGPAWGFNGAVVEHEDFRAALRWTEEASQGEGE